LGGFGAEELSLLLLAVLLVFDVLVGVVVMGKASFSLGWEVEGWEDGRGGKADGAGLLLGEPMPNIFFRAEVDSLAFIGGVLGGGGKRGHGAGGAVWACGFGGCFERFASRFDGFEINRKLKRKHESCSICEVTERLNTREYMVNINIFEFVNWNAPQHLQNSECFSRPGFYASRCMMSCVTVNFLVLVL
jgi:hypothetical protein